MLSITANEEGTGFWNEPAQVPPERVAWAPAEEGRSQERLWEEEDQRIREGEHISNF